MGDVDLGDAIRAFWHELRTGLLLGLAMACIAYLRALTWGSSPGMALTVALAIFTIVVWANGLGSLLPLLAARLRIDPTVIRIGSKRPPGRQCCVTGTSILRYWKWLAMARHRARAQCAGN